MPNVLIYGDTFRSPELRHEVPVGIPDPFLYAEADGVRHAVISSLEAPRLEKLGLELHPPEEFGRDELVKQGWTREEINLEIVRRAVASLGLKSAVTPFGFPLKVADVLRGDGIEVRADRQFFDGRRRAKSEAELAGIRRAQRAAEAGMGAARDLLRRAQVQNGGISVDGDPVTSELLKAAIQRAFVEHGATSEEFIVAHGPQSAIGHESGSGRIVAGEPIVIDLWPRDKESACFADMTRTFVVGEPASELVEWQGLCREAIDRSLREIRAGVKGSVPNDAACEVFEEAGYPTQRTKGDGELLEHGFFHSLGHGVGLEVHEEPSLALVGHDELVAGDVVTIEPGLYRPGFGGCRLEDLVLVTEDGAENLTSFPYDLQP